MNGLTRWLTTPLAGTATVLAGLALLAIPLHHLTAARPVPPPPVAPTATASLPAVLRLKLLEPARALRITCGGQVWVDVPQLPAGESEYDVQVLLDDRGLELTVTADFGPARGRPAAETAVFITLLPDGFAEQTRYALGAGKLEQTLQFDWPTTGGAAKP